MARVAQWTPIVDEQFPPVPGSSFGTVTLATVPAGATVLRVLYSVIMWRGERPDEPIVQSSVSVPVAVGVYYTGDLVDPGSPPLPWSDRAAEGTVWSGRHRWMWWEQLAWRTDGAVWMAPATDGTTRDVEANRGSGAAAAAEVRVAWEVDLTDPAVYRPAAMVTGRALLLVQE